MNRNTGIKVRLGGTHFDSHTDSLHHFIRAHANHVNAHHLFIHTRSDEFHDSLALFIVAVENPIHEIGKSALVDFDIILAVLGNGLWFGQAASTNGGMRKDNRRNVFIRNLGIRNASKDTVRQATSRSNGHGSEFHKTADIA